MQFPWEPFTVFQLGAITYPQAGDYLDHAPQYKLQLDAEMRSTLDRDYGLVFSAEGPFAVPRIGFKSVVKQLLMARVSDQDRQKFNVTENLMNWPNYYVYVKN